MDTTTIARTILGEVTLDNFRSRDFKLHFPTQKLLEALGGLTVEEIEDWDDSASWDVPTPDLSDLIPGVEYDDETDTSFDLEGVEIPEDAVMRIQEAASWAASSGTQSAALKEVLSTLERAIETFSDWRYEYSDDYNNFYSGVAKGVQNVDATYEDTTIVANTDLVHVVNDALAGYGMFSPQHDLDGQAVEDYIKERFHWLWKLFEIYGMSKPTPDLSNVENFDGKYFDELIKEIEMEYGLSLS